MKKNSKQSKTTMPATPKQTVRCELAFATQFGTTFNSLVTDDQGGFWFVQNEDGATQFKRCLYRMKDGTMATEAQMTADNMTPVSIAEALEWAGQAFVYSEGSSGWPEELFLQASMALKPSDGVVTLKPEVKVLLDASQFSAVVHAAVEPKLSPGDAWGQFWASDKVPDGLNEWPTATRARK